MATSSINSAAIQSLLQLDYTSLGSNSSEVTSAYLAKLSEIGNTLTADTSSYSSALSQMMGSGSTFSLSGSSNYLSSLANGTSSSATGAYLSESDKSADAATNTCLTSMDMSGLYGSYGLGDLQSNVSALMGSGNSMQMAFTPDVTGQTSATADGAEQTATAAGTSAQVNFGDFAGTSMTNGIDAYSIASTFTNGKTAMTFDGFTAGTTQHDAAKSSNISYEDSLAHANNMYQTGDYSSLYNTTNSSNTQIMDAYSKFMTSYMSSMGLGEEEMKSVLSFYTSSFNSYASAMTGYNSNFVSTSYDTSYMTTVSTSNVLPTYDSLVGEVETNEG